MSNQRERRFLDAQDVELRASDDGSRRISGYFAVFEKFSPIYGRFREKIARGFFDEAIKRDDVRALFNHDPSRLIGRNRAGTLTLKSDETGLYGEVSEVPNTSTGDEVMENLRLGNLSGASFSFSLPPEGGDSWEKGQDGVWERTLRQIGTLFDVSVVTSPFYPDTSVSARELRSDLEASFERWCESHPEAIEPPEDVVPSRRVGLRQRLSELA